MVYPLMTLSVLCRSTRVYRLNNVGDECPLTHSRSGTGRALVDFEASRREVRGRAKGFTACTACTSSVGGPWNRRRGPASIIRFFLCRRLRGPHLPLDLTIPKLDQRIR